MKLGKTDTDGDIISRLHGDKVIWVIVFLLSLISILLVYSSSSSLAFMKDKTNFSFLVKQLQFVLLGLAALYACYKIPLGWYRFLAFPALGVSVVLLVVTLAVGKEVNGARRWIEVGGLTFQPTEMAKIAIILYLARALEMFRLDTFKDFLIKIVAPLGVTCGLILVGSVSAALLVGLIATGMLIMAGIKWDYLFKTAGICLIALMGLVIINRTTGKIERISTAISRIEHFFSDEESLEGLSPAEQQKIKDETYQADMAKIAISSAPIQGKGPGKSTQRYFLPHPYSDYIFTIIVEEYGLLGGTFVILLYIWFLFRCVMMVRHCRKVFSALTVSGLALLITLQATLHILVNVGIFPVTGHTLPLVSLGGTSLIILSGAFGIVLAVSRTIDTGSSPKMAVAAADGVQIAADPADALQHPVEDEDTRHEIMGPNGEFK